MKRYDPQWTDQERADYDEVIVKENCGEALYD